MKKSVYSVHFPPKIFSVIGQTYPTIIKTTEIASIYSEWERISVKKSNRSYNFGPHYLLSLFFLKSVRVGKQWTIKNQAQRKEILMRNSVYKSHWFLTVCICLYSSESI